MNIIAMEKEDFDRLLQRLDGLEQFVREAVSLNKLPNGDYEFNYYTLEIALELLGIKKDNWYKNYRPFKVIPYSTYNRQTWIKKSDIESFLAERRIAS